MKIRQLVHILFVMMLPSVVAGQVQELSLGDVLGRARKQSLAAIRAENVFLSGYWKYRAYQAELRPGLTLNTNPFGYNRTMTQRYNYDENTEEYREQQSLQSTANLSLSQQLPFSGGRVYLDSDLGRLVNYSTRELVEYSATPLRIGLVQPIWGFNELRWQQKIAPLEYEKARKAYIQSLQQVQVAAVDYYFGLMQAQIRYQIARETLSSTDSLLVMAHQRYAIAAIRRNELLDLKLKRLQASTQLIEAEKSLKQAQFELTSFLGMPQGDTLVPRLPANLPLRQVDTQEARSKAQAYNPGLLGLRRQALQAARDVEASRKRRYADANITASYGLNQVGQTLTQSYQDPLSQQHFSLALSIPLVDWGGRKGNYLMAQKNKEVVEAEIQQQKLDFDKEVILKTLDFNSQYALIDRKRQAQEIAKESYAITRRQFLAGNADVMRLNASQAALKQARLDYVNGIYSYWKNYYQLQALTLYDFLRGKAITEDFDKIIHSDE